MAVKYHCVVYSSTSSGWTEVYYDLLPDQQDRLNALFRDGESDQAFAYVNEQKIKVARFQKVSGVWDDF